MTEDDLLDLLKTDEAAKITRHAPRTLDNMRVYKKGPPFVKVGGRVFYPRRLLLNWMAQQHGPNAMNL